MFRESKPTNKALYSLPEIYTNSVKIIAENEGHRNASEVIRKAILKYAGVETIEELMKSVKQQFTFYDRAETEISDYIRDKKIGIRPGVMYDREKATYIGLQSAKDEYFSSPKSIHERDLEFYIRKRIKHDSEFRQTILTMYGKQILVIKKLDLYRAYVFAKIAEEIAKEEGIE